jgi:hypothetical protein
MVSPESAGTPLAPTSPHSKTTHTVNSASPKRELTRMFRVPKDKVKPAPRHQQSPISTSNRLLGSESERSRVMMTQKAPPNTHNTINPGQLSNTTVNYEQPNLKHKEQPLPPEERPLTSPLLYQTNLQGGNIKKMISNHSEISCARNSLTPSKYFFKTSTTLPPRHLLIVADK